MPATYRGRETDFVQNEVLPDGLHRWVVRGYKTGGVQWQVVNPANFDVPHAGWFDTKKQLNWRDLLELAHDLACKRFPAKAEKSRRDYLNSYRR